MHSKSLSTTSSAHTTPSSSSSSSGGVSMSSPLPSSSTSSTMSHLAAAAAANHHLHTHHNSHLHSHHPAHHSHHHANGSLLAASMGGLGLASSCAALRSLATGNGHVPEMCPVCGIKLSAEEWNSHFLTELDRLYKLSAGVDRPNLQATYMFAPPCPSQENAIRTSHNRWEVGFTI